MGLQQLVQYIAEQYKRGFSPAQIREFLIRNNYPADVVDQAIAYANQQSGSGLQSFVQKHMQEGFDADSIRRYLTAYGYPPQEVEKAINSAQPSMKVHHHHEISNKVFGLFVVLIVAIIGLTAFFLIGGGGEKALLDYNLKTLDKNVKQGSEIRYTHSFKNIGEKKDYDVVVEYMVQDTDSYDIVHRRQETIGIDTLETQDGTFPIAKDYPPGDYILKAIVKYDDKEARAYDSFTIIKDTARIPDPSCNDGIKNQNEKEVDCGGPCKSCEQKEETCNDEIKNQDEKGVDCGGSCEPCPSCNDGIKNQGEEGIDCGGPCEPCEGEEGREATCNDGLKNQDEKGVDCGGPCEPCEKEETCNDGIKNQGEEGIDCGGPCEPCQEFETDLSTNQILEQVKTLEKDYKKGIRMCKAINNDKKRDDCFLSLATGKINMSSICDHVQSKSKADICYVNFMKQNDFSVCDKIYESYLKRSCKSYEKMSAQATEAGEEETEENITQQNQTIQHTNTTQSNETSPQERWDEMKNQTIGREDQEELLDIANDMQGQPADCKSMECFRTHFNNCTLAKHTYSLNESSTYYNEIKGGAGNNCEVFTKVNLHRQTGLIGKTMTCHMDNSTSFEKEFNQTLSALNSDEIVACEGELADSYGE